MQLKDICEEFRTDTLSEKYDDRVAKSHKVYLGKLRGSAKDWYAKKMKNREEAVIECFSQELYRFFIPHQVETRHLENKDSGSQYICSEMSQGFGPLPYNQQAKFLSGLFTGLGQIAVIAMFLCENDLKNGNIGINARNQIVKLDGDRAFITLRHILLPSEPFPVNPADYRITPKAIAELPFVFDFTAFNWLDIIDQGTYYPDSEIVSRDLSDSPRFQAEVNEGLLKICLLTDSLIEVLARAYVPVRIRDHFIQFLQSRRNELRASALQNPSFQESLLQPSADAIYHAFIQHSNTFLVDGRSLVLPEQQATNNKKVCWRFSVLRAEASLQVLRHHKAITDDQKLRAYIHRKQRELDQAKQQHPEHITNIIASLDKKHALLRTNFPLLEESLKILERLQKYRKDGTRVQEYVDRQSLAFLRNQSGDTAFLRQMQVEVQDYKDSLAQECQALLDANEKNLKDIEATAVSAHDKKVFDLIAEYNKELDQNIRNIDKLVEIRQRLGDILAPLNSAYMQHVKKELQYLSVDTCFDTPKLRRERQALIGAIERLLCRINPKDRANGAAFKEVNELLQSPLFIGNRLKRECFELLEKVALYKIGHNDRKLLSFVATARAVLLKYDVLDIEHLKDFKAHYVQILSFVKNPKINQIKLKFHALNQAQHLSQRFRTEQIAMMEQMLCDVPCDRRGDDSSYQNVDALLQKLLAAPPKAGAKKAVAFGYEENNPDNFFRPEAARTTPAFIRFTVSRIGE